MTQLFKESSVVVMSLPQWLDWASGNNINEFVALPMIQRGSVWKPQQIIDLWDSLLRGMPIGGFMLNILPIGTAVTRIGKKKKEFLDDEGIGLLDGQQRTLAMLLGWRLPNDDRMDRRVWVDFLDKPENGHLYRLRVTTENHKFGFRRDAPSIKLHLHERSKAYKAYEEQFGYEAVAPIEPVKVTLDNARPYVFGHSLPLDLHWLIQKWRELEQNEGQWIEVVMHQLREFEKYRETAKVWGKYNVWAAIEKDEDMVAQIEGRVKSFAESLSSLFEMMVPLIKVESKFFDARDDDIEPPLAVLFKRIGSGGTELTNADYVYSVIKHRYPETYDLVEALHGNGNIASVLSSTDLVMTTLRLAAANKSLPDHESPDKTQFHNMLKLQEGNFLTKQFLPLIQGEKIAKAFDTLHGTLIFHKHKNPNGLPLHAFPLLKRPLVQVLLRWILMTDDEISNYRDEIIRFVLFWLLSVTDAKKASLLAFKILNEEPTKSINCGFPGKLICERLIKEGSAITMASPQVVEKIDNLVSSKNLEDQNKPLRGWNSRFDIRNESYENQQSRAFYARWWNKDNNHSHPILLWLQREYVSTKFADVNPLAGRDEETPYDYDHICPSNHWGEWTGSHKGTRLIDFSNNSKAHGQVGNSIGNIRVWGSRENRSDGAEAPVYKLGLKPRTYESDGLANVKHSKEELLCWSAIPNTEDYINALTDCSGEDSDPKAWTVDRTVAFQHAIELRAFYLYKRYFDEPGFVEWCGDDGLTLCRINQPEP